MELTKEQESVLDLAILKFGTPAQIDMFIEEASELTIELCKYKRGRGFTATEEIADVFIMLKQMEKIFDYNNHVQTMIDLKVQRLKQRLERIGS